MAATAVAPSRRWRRWSVMGSDLGLSTTLKNWCRLQWIIPIPGRLMDRLDDLALYLSIVDAGSLAEAARRTRRSPPSVTRRLNELERRLGVRLLDRNTRRLSPTEA